MQTNFELLRRNVLKNKNKLRTLKDSSAIDSLKDSIKSEALKSRNFCIRILRKSYCFGNLGEEHLNTLARSMTKLSVTQGYRILTKGTLGDSCFILAEGLAKIHDELSDIDMESNIGIVQAESIIGENCFFMDELRPHNVTIVSKSAVLFVLPLKIYSDLQEEAKIVTDNHRSHLAKSVVDREHAFFNLSQENKQSVIESMVSVSFADNQLICKQGQPAKTFYILTEGTCVETFINKDGIEREVRVLTVGNSFGEISFQQGNMKYKSNFIAAGNVTCLTLLKSDYQLMSTSANEELVRSNVEKGIGNISRRLLFRPEVKIQRRISGVDQRNVRNVSKVEKVIRCMAKFLTESIWNSFYSRLYRELLLRNTEEVKKLYGVYAVWLKEKISKVSRPEGVQAVGTMMSRIFEADILRNATLFVGSSKEDVGLETLGLSDLPEWKPIDSLASATFISSLMKVRGQLRDKLCRGFTVQQLMECSKVCKLVTVPPLTKICMLNCNSRDLYFIVSGAVRVYIDDPRVFISNRKQKSLDTSGEAFEMYYDVMQFHEDLFPGDMFGEAALDGGTIRTSLYVSMNHCQICMISYEDFINIRSGEYQRNSVQLSVDAKYNYLSKISLFKAWEPYRLYRLAVSSVSIEYAKDKVILEKKKISKNIIVLLTGEAMVYSPLRREGNMTSNDVIAVLQAGDYFGETGILNTMLRLDFVLKECCDIVAATPVEALMIPPSCFQLFDDILGSIHTVKTSYAHKRELWEHRYERLAAGRIYTLDRMLKNKDQLLDKNEMDSFSKIREEEFHDRQWRLETSKLGLDIDKQISDRYINIEEAIESCNNSVIDSEKSVKRSKTKKQLDDDNVSVISDDATNNPNYFYNYYNGIVFSDKCLYERTISVKSVGSVANESVLTDLVESKRALYKENDSSSVCSNASLGSSTRCISLMSKVKENQAYNNYIHGKKSLNLSEDEKNLLRMRLPSIKGAIK